MLGTSRYVKCGLLRLHINQSILVYEETPVTSPLIVIIDDDEALRASLTDLMRSAGYQAEAFASAEAFLQSTLPTLFDCAIADIQMPEMGGADLLRKLREEGIRAPVILMTGLQNKCLDDEAASIGAQHLLRKPFEIEFLLNCVEASIPHLLP
jgi:FixJ family two-component response regulator